MDTPISITIDLAKLIEATLPLFFGLFAGAWVLLRFMIFRPLTRIAGDLEEVKNLFHNSSDRITILETKMKLFEQLKKGGCE